MGYSFAGGTTDGPGAFDFIQGDNSSHPQNPLWEIVKKAVTPSAPPEQVECQQPKPILLNTGYAHTPYEWQPSTVDVQMLRVGQFVMLIMPGELTTMSGRRMRKALRKALIAQNVLGNDAYVVIAGPANTYGHYVATKEEYGVQRYEGASTLFGQYTLDAYIDRYTQLVPYLAPTVMGTPSSDPPPAEQTSKAMSLRIGVVLDNTPIGKKIGQVSSDVGKTPYKAGQKVTASFVGACPRNNLRLEGTFMTVDQQVAGGWKTVRTDSHDSTIFEWKRDNLVLGYSTTTLSWAIEDGTPAGTYRLTYYGDWKNGLGGKITAFTSSSSPFTVS